MYTVFIKETSTSSAVAVSRLQDLEQAISFGFQLHQISSCKHYIAVKDDDVLVASFMRVDSVTLPKLNSNPDIKSEDKKHVFGLRKRN